VNEVELLKARVEELVVERNALRESISQPATGDVRLSYEELHANYLVLIDRFKKEMKQAERANYELTKRVAELEVDVLKSDAEAVMWRERALNMTNKHSALIDLKSANDERLCKEAALLRQQVGDLQSQLAWTPVNEGLPTEPGWYVFDRALTRTPRRGDMSGSAASSSRRMVRYELVGLGLVRYAHRRGLGHYDDARSFHIP
jgi:hypothetical protein